MNTLIFKSWIEFINREDKLLNGVSEDFAAANPNFEKDNESNEGCWNCTRSSRSSRCTDCTDCSRCTDLKNAIPVEQEENSEAGLNVPVIENIHQKVLEVTSNPNALNMAYWHSCETTHCRAGWVVHLAGKEGYSLEKKTSTLFAAMQIYHKSNPGIPVSPTRFYGTNEEAMEDIKRCAEEEIKQNK